MINAQTLKEEYPNTNFYGFNIRYYDGTVSKLYKTVARAYKQAGKDALHGKDNSLMAFCVEDGEMKYIELACC